MFTYIKLLCDNIRLNRVTIVSPNMSRWYLYLKVSLTLHSWMQYGSKLATKTIRCIYTFTSISFMYTSITNMLLASCNARAMSECDFVSTFSHWKDSNIPYNKKQNRRTERYDWLRWISLYLESPSAVTSLHYVCYLHEENKSGSSVNELRYS